MPSREQMERAIREIEALSEDDSFRRDDDGRVALASHGRGTDDGYSFWGELTHAQKRDALAGGVDWAGFIDDEKADVIGRVLDGEPAAAWMDGIKYYNPHEDFPRPLTRKEHAAYLADIAASYGMTVEEMDDYYESLAGDAPADGDRRRREPEPERYDLGLDPRPAGRRRDSARASAMADTVEASGAADPAAAFHARLEELRREGAYDRWRGGRVPWGEATATAKLDGILWAALGTSPAGGPMTPAAEILAAVEREIDPDRLSPPQRELLRDVRADFDAGRLDGQDRASRMDRAHDALHWVAGIEHFDRRLERYKQDGLYNRPANTPWGEVPEADKVHAIVGLAHRERPPGDYALAAIEREVDYGRLPPGRSEALQVLRARIDAGELDGHQPRDLGDRANYALRLAEFEMRIGDYKRDGDPWQGGAPRPWAALPEVRKLDLIVQEAGHLHLHFEPREYEIIDREVDLARVPEGRRRGIESNRERLRIGPEEYERRRQEKYAPPNEAAAAFKRRIEEGLWTTCFTDGARIFADWSDLTAEAKLHELARAMDWDRVPESYFRTMVERELEVADLPPEKRAALEHPGENCHVFAAGFEDGSRSDAPPPGRDAAAADDGREARCRELFDTANRVQFAEFLEEKSLDPEVALAPAARVREAYMRAAEATWDSFRGELESCSDAEIQEALDHFRAKEAQLGDRQPKTLMDLLQAGGFFGPAGVALAGQDDGAPALRDTTRNLVEAVMLDIWPRNAAIVDFGLDSQAHYEALYYPLREGEITPEQLDAAVGRGAELTALARAAPSNPHKGIAFRTSRDAPRPGPEGRADGEGLPSPGEIAGPQGPEEAGKAMRYLGERTEYGIIVLKEDADGWKTPLPMRNDLRDHSPDGPEWGYAGSGPSQLALAILCDTIGEREALEHYQDFKSAVVAALPHDRWELGRADVLAWYEEHRGPERDGAAGPEARAEAPSPGPPPSLTAAILDDPRSILPDSGPGNGNDHDHDHGPGRGR